MTSTEYATKLRDPRWQKRRLEIFGLHEFTCQDCGTKEHELHAHHCWYIDGRDPWDYPDHCYRCLCSGCHVNRHPTEKHAVFMFRQVLGRNDQTTLEKIADFFTECVVYKKGVSITEIIVPKPPIAWPEWAMEAFLAPKKSSAPVRTEPPGVAL